MPTANYYIGPEDGWTQVATTPDFVRTSGYPYTHPYYVYAGASPPSELPTAGEGEMTISGAPGDGDTVTIGSETYTFVTAGTDPFEVVIGGDATETGTNFADVVNADSTLVTASDAAGVVTFTSIAVGTAGNYAMSESATNVTIDSALTGGTNVTQGVAVCHHPFEVNVTMTENLYARVISPVPNSNPAGGKLRLDVFTIV